MRAYLSVTDHDTIRIHDFDGQIADREVRTIEDLSYFLMPFAEDGVLLGFQASSSMDFADEYTSDPEVLATIEWIMTGGDPDQEVA